MVPEGGEQVTSTLILELSTAVGVGKRTTAVATVPQTHTCVLPEHWMTGGVVSRVTVTVNVHTADSRQELVARQVTGVVPKLNELPEAGVQVMDAVVGQPLVVVGVG